MLALDNGFGIAALTQEQQAGPQLGCIASLSIAASKSFQDVFRVGSVRQSDPYANRFLICHRAPACFVCAGAPCGRYHLGSGPGN